MNDATEEGGTAGPPTRDLTHKKAREAGRRRRGREDSVTRELLLDAVEALLVEHGHSAVTSRKIGERAGVTHQTVFYYFKTLDDLFLALISRNAKRFQERLESALRDEHPLRALWNIARDRESGVIELQLKAMAVHNTAVRQAMSANLEIFRARAIDALTCVVGDCWPEDPYMAPALALMIESLGRYLVLDDAMAISTGHDHALRVIECLIEGFEQNKPHSANDRRQS